MVCRRAAKCEPEPMKSRRVLWGASPGADMKETLNVTKKAATFAPQMPSEYNSSKIRPSCHAKIIGKTKYQQIKSDARNAVQGRLD